MKLEKKRMTWRSSLLSTTSRGRSYRTCTHPLLFFQICLLILKQWLFLFNSLLKSDKKLARDSKQTNVINDGLLVAFFFLLLLLRFYP